MPWHGSDMGRGEYFRLLRREYNRVKRLQPGFKFGDGFCYNCGSQIGDGTDLRRKYCDKACAKEHNNRVYARTQAQMRGRFHLDSRD